MSAGRLLIVSPHFPPVNTPDLQRVRLSLQHFVAAGWEVTVLTVDDPTPVAPLEPELLDAVPASVRVVRARCCSRGWTSRLGVNNVALRALPFLFLAGCRLLGNQRYDVVYFSTTMFIVLPFGRMWRALYGVPYVIDLQDPWVTDFYERPGAPPPPGGWKYRITRGVARWLEGWTMRRTAHLITVSAPYAESVRTRYPDVRLLPVTEIPFGAPDADLQYLRTRLAGRPAILRPGGFRLVFAGAVGPGSGQALEILFAAMAELRKEDVGLSAHFYGTSYAQAGATQPATRSLATRYKLLECVHEQAERLPYFAALQVTLEADANILLGSTDQAFIPSKLLALLAAGRPILAIAHGGSALAARLDQLGQPYTSIDGDQTSLPAIAATVARLRELVRGTSMVSTPSVPAASTTSALATRQLEILASVSGAPL